MNSDDQEALARIVSPSFVSISETEKWVNTIDKLKEFDILHVKGSTDRSTKIVTPLIDNR